MSKKIRGYRVNRRWRGARSIRFNGFYHYKQILPPDGEKNAKSDVW